jgi:AraC-like DNA-binding protein
MYFILWTILLIAFASQCIFLIVTLTIKKVANKKANAILIFLLSVILCICISNIWSATYLYRQFPFVSNIARGMVLLLGPALYLYTLSVLKPDFRFRPIHILHLIPYVVAFVIFRIQGRSYSKEIIIASVDSLMQGRSSMDWITTLWFVLYFIHLLIYVAFARKQMRSSVKDKESNYLMPLQQRANWLKQFAFIFILIALVFIGITGYIMATGVYTITGNFIYTIVLALLIYLIAWQAISDKTLLVPDFATKYRSGNMNDEQKKAILSRLLHLFEHEKIFTNPELKLSVIAEKVQAHPHVLSQVINEKLNKTFNELLNYYRIEEFKAKVNKQEYANYSIMGIATKVGYNSKSSFNGAFKKQNGVTPSEYMKSIT